MVDVEFEIDEVWLQCTCCDTFQFFKGVVASPKGRWRSIALSLQPKFLNCFWWVSADPWALDIDRSGRQRKPPTMIIFEGVRRHYPVLPKIVPMPKIVGSRKMPLNYIIITSGRSYIIALPVQGGWIVNRKEYHEQFLQRDYILKLFRPGPRI